MGKYWFMVGLFVLDRVTKILFLKNPYWSSGPEGFFSLSVNKNLTFSLPLRAEIFYPATALILIIIFYYWYKNYRERGSLWWPWSLLLIGAISNLLDRIRYGGVIDWLHIPGLTVFNISDVYITIGVLWLLAYSLFKRTDRKKFDPPTPSP